MSHTTGTVQTLMPAVVIGPDTGALPDAPNTWTHNFVHAPPPDPSGTKLIVLHFTNVVLPPNNRLEVDLGYGTDVFTAADGAAFWTRPANVHAFADKKIPIRYITNGAVNGSVTIDKYGRGERSGKDPGPEYASPLFDCLTNSDPFLPNTPFVEPEYAKFWLCNQPPNWENIRCVAAGDIRRDIARSVGMIVSLHGDHVSTCSGTLVGPDLFLTAGHCIAPGEEVAAASVTFDFETECDGSRPVGYVARFHKVKTLVKRRYGFFNGIDYDFALLQFEGPIGVPHVQMRHDLPVPGEQVFGVHHPNGATKKLSRKHASGFATVSSSDDSSVDVNLDVAGGSSGSGLFDAAGRIVGVCASGSACGLGYFPTKSIIPEITTPPVEPPINRDVMLVLDRSGSMSLLGSSGRRKIEELRDAASLFVQLVRANGGNRVGMVSFSTTASAPVDSGILPVTVGSKAALVGPAPYITGTVGAIAPGGNTSIGAGLEAARLQFPAPGPNPRSILLMTDGLQNTPPWAQNIALGDIILHAVGYGTDASLDGALLTNLAAGNGGMYARADTNLQLEKFFAQAFGNIFESGLLTDPEFFLPKGQRSAKPFPFDVCGEESITAVVGWDHTDAQLVVQLRTPSGLAVIAGSPLVESATGRTWTFLRVPLEYNGERDGTWQVEVMRRGGGEFPPPDLDMHYFVNVIAGGGARLIRRTHRDRYYTGDTINPMVALVFGDGSFAEANSVQVVVTKPDTAIGNILTKNGLGNPETIDTDTIPVRQSALLRLERAGGPLVGYSQERFELLGGPEQRRGAMEGGGIYGLPLKDLLTVEGNYTFHAIANYGEGCSATRELIWTVHADAGIDPSRTDVVVVATGTRGDGKTVGTVTYVPRDRYGNHVGPGRGDSITVTGVDGTVVTGPVTDNGDGSYTVPIAWDPGTHPGVAVGQPGRAPVVVHEPTPGAPPGGSRRCRLCWMLFWIVLVIALVLLILLIVK